MGRFLTENHASASSAYSDFSSQQLKRKLRAVLGESSETGSVVDWELNGVRTSPIDHESQQDDYNLLASIQKGTEQAAGEDE